MKLELKHLAPYLPYGLEIITELNSVQKVGGLADMYHIHYYDDKTEEGDEPLIEEIKPILRPLSDLTKTGYHFIYDKETDIESIIDWIELDDESKLTCKYSYEFWSLLFENHFDVFGLIEKGLAIDINTLK